MANWRGQDVGRILEEIVISMYVAVILVPGPWSLVPGPWSLVEGACWDSQSVALLIQWYSLLAT